MVTIAFTPSLLQSINICCLENHSGTNRSRLCQWNITANTTPSSNQSGPLYLWVCVKNTFSSDFPFCRNVHKSYTMQARKSLCLSTALLEVWVVFILLGPSDTLNRSNKEEVIQISSRIHQAFFWRSVCYITWYSDYLPWDLYPNLNDLLIFV